MMWFSPISCLLFLSIPFIAVASEHRPAWSRRHQEVARRAPGNVDVHKRQTFANARFTFYDVGLGACGQNNVASDFIVALNVEQYGGGFPGPFCFQSITISYGGKTAQATIMDECMGCPYGGLDFSRGLFDFFASESAGVIYGTWWFGGGSGGGGDQPTTSSTPEWTPTTTTPQWTPTSTWTPPTTTEQPTTTWTPTTTSTTPTTTSTSTTTTSTSTTTTSTSSSASDTATSALAIPTDIPSQISSVIEQINDALVDLAMLLTASKNST
ncbi:hypothetical protein SCLCIDRAFT_1212480 [Scleroderma citrinum Foug A]|uniref:RlpA-like protein double-psi beta-barrel domain-containing protein n=1 Tax=Scleroderma citrinum Foug A TaxID=1036808 RepID=A0A0C3EBG8_9AGAM|nr:hypothetical protein SCLCIDRAFT_1212480 [Scleroderma citrinum Foug A]